MYNLLRLAALLLSLLFDFRLNGQVSIRRILTALAVFLVFSGVSDAEVGVVSSELSRVETRTKHLNQAKKKSSDNKKHTRDGGDEVCFVCIFLRTMHSPTR